MVVIGHHENVGPWGLVLFVWVRGWGGLLYVDVGVLFRG